MNYFDVDILIADKLPELLPKVDGDEINADDVDTITRLCEAVSSFIDRYCKRRAGYFAAAVYTDDVIEAGTVRRYRGEGKRYLRIGNHVAGTLSVTSPVIAADRYYEHDSNGWLYALDTNFNDEGDYFVNSDCFFEAGRPYEITAVWKFDPSPADVIEAGSQIVAAIWDKGKGVVGEVTPAGFVVDRDIPLTAAALLKPYIKRPFEID